MHLAGRELLVPAPVIAEVGYLVGRARDGGPRAESLFLQAVADGDFSAVELTARDYRRMSELVLQYADFPLGTTDAAVVAVAERFGIAEIATLDRRHFTVIRPRHVDTLTLVPQQAGQ